MELDITKLTVATAAAKQELLERAIDVLVELYGYMPNEYIDLIMSLAS